MGKKLAVSAVLLALVDDSTPPPPPPGAFNWVSSDPAVVLEPDATGATCVANLSTSTQADIEVTDSAGNPVAGGVITFDQASGILTFEPNAVATVAAGVPVTARAAMRRR